jgi:S-phase kinase-associated protein 1
MAEFQPKKRCMPQKQTTELLSLDDAENTSVYETDHVILKSNTMRASQGTCACLISRPQGMFSRPIVGKQGACSCADPKKKQDAKETRETRPVLHVPAKGAALSALLKTMMDNTDEKVFTVNVDETILEHIAHYLTYHADKPLPPNIPKPLPSRNMEDWVADAWDCKFCDKPIEIMFQIMLAANYMDIPPLFDLATAKCSSFVVGKTPQELRRDLKEKDDFTKKQADELIEESAWINS